MESIFEFNKPKPIAYRTKDILFNNNLEQEVMDLLSEVDQSNNIIPRVRDVLLVIDYNYMNINANIKCGMITNWKDILTEIKNKYVVKQLVTFEKYLRSRGENIQNNVNGDVEFMDTCYIMNESAEIVDVKIMNLLSIYNEYENARKQSLNNTPMMDEVKRYILEF